MTTISITLLRVNEKNIAIILKIWLCKKFQNAYFAQPIAKNWNCFQECNRRQSIWTMTGRDRLLENSKKIKKKETWERRTCRWAFLRSELHRRSAHPEQKCSHALLANGSLATNCRANCSTVQSRFHFRSFRRLSSYSWQMGRDHDLKSQHFNRFSFDDAMNQSRLINTEWSPSNCHFIRHRIIVMLSRYLLFLINDSYVREEILVDLVPI